MSAFREFCGAGARGIALSDQAWISPNPMKTSPRRLAMWARTAFSGGAVLVQTEPVWYWWRWPSGSLHRPPDHAQNPAWAGLPRRNLRVFAKALGVKLPK